MELGNKNLLYVDESFLDCYAPYTHNELQILYRFFKQFQIDKTLTVTLPFSIFQDMFHYETENLDYLPQSPPGPSLLEGSQTEGL